MHYTLYHIECVLYERESVCLLYVSYLSSMCTCQILVECVLYEVCLLYVSYLSRMCTLRERVSMSLVCVISQFNVYLPNLSRMCTLWSMSLVCVIHISNAGHALHHLHTSAVCDTKYHTHTSNATYDASYIISHTQISSNKYRT